MQGEAAAREQVQIMTQNDGSQRRLLRREKNRASAAASRAKREAYTASLEAEVNVRASTAA